MVLGVTCSTQFAFLAGVEDGQVLTTAVNRIEIGAIDEASEDLESTLGEISRALAQIRPELVVLLLPEPTRQFKFTHSQLAPRITLETLVRLPAVQAAIPVDVMSRKTVRSRLGLAFSGDLSSHVGERFPTPSAPYWKAGRDVAALAALAGESG